MHVALQTAQNQASLEMPLRAEQLMTAHFNLAVLSSETSVNNTFDAKKPETNMLTLPCPLQLPMTRRPTLRFRVDIIVQIGYNPQEPYPQHAEEITVLLMVYWQVLNLMILGIRILLLMSQSTSTPTTTATI